MMRGPINIRPTKVYAPVHIYIKEWMEKMKDRQKWRLFVEEAKAHRGL